MLEFRAIKYKNKTLDFAVVADSLPVQVQNGQYQLPSEDDFLVKVHAAALNPVDLIIKNSLSPWLFRGTRGFGMDYSGDIVAIGRQAAAATGLAVGDRIAGLYQKPLGAGTISEYLLVDHKKPEGRNARKLPDSMSYQEGAAYPLVFGTAQTMFDTVAKGNSFGKVLVLGAGTAVGRHCVQLALKVYGAEHVVVTCSARTEHTIRALGATSVIDYTQHPSILNPVLEAVKETGPFDVVLDCCGNSDLFPQMAAVLKPRGEAGSYVSIVGDTKANFKTSSIGGLVLGSFWVTVRMVRNTLGLLPYFYSQALLDQGGSWPDKCIKNLSEGKVRVFIDSEYAMADTHKAVDRLLSNQASGKVIVNVV
ncbi:GroES-like protein [Metschnikowia bicuspidata var. bicuspidata NRRL YB-4993]|uniref:GroES-like protein n=1 Tax=Metschnikowia bicuspidata var. bicuspidata NRRL YB-4993 TaxID=869754 RepID=A0A1A0H865_9ASCO|nr:GroES-like protein [Metschnikowia bicuspidata var. bicuspidata NRRL YB-4993]OBA20175.1 GroES-like protein [Metschnikowia bicuspidata var. bicuspidata NRRL YB-4993]